MSRREKNPFKGISEENWRSFEEEHKRDRVLPREVFLSLGQTLLMLAIGIGGFVGVAYTGQTALLALGVLFTLLGTLNSFVTMFYLLMWFIGFVGLSARNIEKELR